MPNSQAYGSPLIPVSHNPQTGEVLFASILSGHVMLGLTRKQRDIP